MSTTMTTMTTMTTKTITMTKTMTKTRTMTRTPMHSTRPEPHTARRTAGASVAVAGCAPTPRRPVRWTGTLGGPAGAPTQQLSSADLAAELEAAVEYVELDRPARIFDSRPGVAPTSVPKGRLLNRQRRTLTTLLGGAVPAAVAASVYVEVTIANASPSGSLVVAPTGPPRSSEPRVRWSSPRTGVSVRTIVDVDALGRFTIFCAGQADVTVEVLGYFT